MNHATKYDSTPASDPCPCKDPRDGDSMFLVVLLGALLTLAIVAVRTCTQGHGSHVRGTTSEASP
jgi:hypothetical protein